MEDYVSFDLAVKLKEKGYPQSTFGLYKMNGAAYISDGRFYEEGCVCNVEYAYTAPRIDQVLKWLRREKKLHIVCPFYEGKGFYFYVQEFNFGGRYNSLDKADDVFKSYEEAAIAGIEYVLDNLL